MTIAKLQIITVTIVSIIVIHEQQPLWLMCLPTHKELSPGMISDHVANGYNDKCVNIIQCK